MDEIILAFVATLSVEEHKRKLEEDAKFVALADNVFEEIPDDVILESIKTISIEEKC